MAAAGTGPLFPYAAPPDERAAGTAPSARTGAGPLAEPRPFGRYDLRYFLAQGGMAAVHLAQTRTATGFRKWFALKIIHAHLARSPRFVQMFMDEARLAARLDHPNVCSVVDFGEAEGTWYLAMEYLHGESLYAVSRRAWQQGGPPRVLAARIVADAARGLHAAHELRAPDGAPGDVVHRDVSPQNIFVLYDGVSKVMDFGIARFRDRLADVTTEGDFRGKVAYAAPEQLEHGAVDRRTDLFALGVVLWETTLGQRLFKRASGAATAAAVIADEIPAPSEISLDYPADLERVVLRALARDPAARFQTADELVRELEKYIARSGELAGVTQVGDYMRRLFADHIAARDELLRRDVGSGAVPQDDLALTTDGRTATATPGGLDATVVESAPPPSRARRAAVLALGAAAVLVAAGAGAGIALNARGDGRANSAAPATAPPAALARPAAAPRPAAVPDAPRALPSVAGPPSAADAHTDLPDGAPRRPRSGRVPPARRAPAVPPLGRMITRYE